MKFQLPKLPQRDTKVTKYRKPINANIGMLLFLVILIYVIYSVFAYMGSTHMVRYEVKEGSLAINTIYRGVVLRDEVVVQSDDAGYINYYTYEGERVAVGDLVYTVDETGKLNELLSMTDENQSSLSEKELRDFRTDIQYFRHGFDSTSYKSVYEFKHTLENSVLKLAHRNMLSSSAAMADQGGVLYRYAPHTGIVSFWIDGLEDKKPADVDADSFDEEIHAKDIIMSNTLVAPGDTVYKVCDNEHWYIVIPVEEEMAKELEEEEVVKVRFLKNQYQSWGNVSTYEHDGQFFVSLEFTNSMVTFASDRYLDIELILHDQTGLKIPVSSIVEKEFFLVPKDYILDLEGGKRGVMRQCYLEDGSISTEYCETDIYSFDSETEEYYLDATQLNAGDILHQLDKQGTFTISKRATLIGVYNINKGYADFKEIRILYQNDEYAIVKINTMYGLSVYDYIVLDAKSVKDDQFINK